MRLQAFGMLVVTVAATLAEVSTSRAEEMAATKSGLMCRTPQALADLTMPNGDAKGWDRMTSREQTERSQDCKDADGATVTVITRRHNTSIVSYQNQTWYVPNINFIVPGPECIHDGTHVTLTGRLGRATEEPGPDVIRPGYTYDLLTVDHPLCFLGIAADPHDSRVALVPIKQGGEAVLRLLQGRHVVVSGDLTAPDNGNQPPENMLIFDPVVQARPQ